MKRKQVYDFIKKNHMQAGKNLHKFFGGRPYADALSLAGQNTRIDLAYVFSRKIMVTMEFIRQNMLK